MTLIVDAHEDIAWNMMCYGRDYTRPAATTRALEESDATIDTGLATLGLPEWLDGKVAVICATLFSMPRRSRFVSKFSQSYATPDEAYATAMRQLDLYRRLADDHAVFRIVYTQSDLDAVLETWQTDSGERQIGLVMLMENADPIRKPDEVGRWHDEGLRVVGPAWEGTRYCGGTGEPGPLTDDGVRLLKRMQELNLALDTSHMADQAFFQAIDRYAGPVIASHSNPRHYVNIDRNLSDDMIRALIQRDGVIGIVPFNSFLIPGWSRRRSDPKDATDIATIVRTIDYVCQRAGDALHVGIGSDFDGGFGAESTPAGIDTIADLQKVAGALREAGYTPADVEAVMSGNWLRILRQSLPG